jgi:copper resistance protein C
MVKKFWLACAVAASLAPAMLLAHARLLASSPSAGAQLDAPPQALTLKFDEKVQLAVLKLSTAGADIPLQFDRGTEGATLVSVALPSLAPGGYRVQWSALTVDDGHVVKGTFSFTVAAH